jgi:hypothetical protein
MEGTPEAFLEWSGEPLTAPASKMRSFLEDSGENEGNDVSDLSEGAIDEAELEAYEPYFRDLPLKVCDLWLFVEAFDWWDSVLCIGAVSTSMAPSYNRLNVAANASEGLRTQAASVNAGLHRKSKAQSRSGEVEKLWKSVSVYENRRVSIILVVMRARITVHLYMCNLQSTTTQTTSASGC